MSALVINGHLFHYEVLGRGKPLILVHGWVGSWRYWVPIMQALSNDYRSYAVDLWGFGDSDHVPPHYDPKLQATLIKDFMDNLGVPKAAIVGHGLGGVIGMTMAKTYPELTDRLMLIGVPLDPSTMDPKLSTQSGDQLARWLLNGSQREEVSAEAEKADPEAIHMLGTSSEESNWMVPLDGLETPSLVIFTEDDPAVNRPESLLTIDNIGAHKVIDFETGGHFPMLDEPTRFVRLLTEFLEIDSPEDIGKIELKEEWKRRVR